MENEPNKLTPKQERAVTALLTSPTIADAAKAAGVAPRTLRRWRRDRAFDDAYRQARRQAFDRAIGRMQQVSTDAANTLADLLNPKVPAHVRATAAVAILKVARESLELEDMNEQIKAIQAHLKRTARYSNR